MSDFAGIGAAAAPQRSSEYLNDGVYLATVMNLKKKVSENPRTRGDKMIILEVAISDVLVSKEYTTPVGGVPKRSNPKGEVVSTFLKFKWFGFMEKMKALLCSIMQIDAETAATLDESAWVEMAERAVQDDGAAVRGAVIKVTAKTIGVPMKDPQADFTRVDFELAETDAAPPTPVEDIPF